MPENPSHTPETLERFLDSTLENVDSAEELAVGLAQRAGMDDEDLMKIGMAVRESVVNAVVHGNRYSTHKKVRFLVSADREKFTVLVADQGEGFDVESVPDPLAPENLMRTSGRGIFLIRSFMDDFQMRRLESGGTEVTLVKHLVSK
jgi:serine/threonine-protein kinase RsbW